VLIAQKHPRRSRFCLRNARRGVRRAASENQGRADEEASSQAHDFLPV
jgi:hypothetical protein